MGIRIWKITENTFCTQNISNTGASYYVVRNENIHAITKINLSEGAT